MKKIIFKNQSMSMKCKYFCTVFIMCLVFLCLSPALIVWANTETKYGEGKIEIDNVEKQETAYFAYQVFKANKNEDGSISNIAWPNDEIKTRTIKVIKTFSESYTSENAQDAADYISAAYKTVSAETYADQSLILTSKELLNKIVIAIYDVTTKVSIPSGTPVVLPEGYWFITTQGPSIDMGETGTSAIYAVLGGEQITINEKTSLPIVDKLVLNDGDGAEYAYSADAQIGQSVMHKVTGKVAKNIATYDTYYYEFEDIMSQGIDYETGTYKVFADNTDITAYFTEGYSVNTDKSRKLSIKCNNLREIPDLALSENSNIVLTYSVHLNTNAVIGASGNPNEVKIIYSSDPYSGQKNSTYSVKDYLYTFALHIEKKDRDTNVPLEKAGFYICATKPDDKASENLYVQKDGTLSTKPYEFISDKNGHIDVSGLDVGIYTVKENNSPEHYKYLTQDTLIEIKAAYDANGIITSLSCTVTGNKDAAAGIDTTDDHIVNGDPGTEAVVAEGLVKATIGNIEMIKMPLSGGNGVGVLIIAGGIIVLLSALLFIVNIKVRS